MSSGAAGVHAEGRMLIGDVDVEHDVIEFAHHLLEGLDARARAHAAGVLVRHRGQLGHGVVGRGDPCRQQVIAGHQVLEGPRLLLLRQVREDELAAAEDHDLLAVTALLHPALRVRVLVLHLHFARRAARELGDGVLEQRVVEVDDGLAGVDRRVVVPPAPVRVPAQPVAHAQAGDAGVHGVREDALRQPQRVLPLFDPVGLVCPRDQIALRAPLVGERAGSLGLRQERCHDGEQDADGDQTGRHDPWSGSHAFTSSPSVWGLRSPTAACPAAGRSLPAPAAP